MILSPCIGVCAYDDVTGWCLGCGRTKDEIATWGGSTEAARGAVWTALPARLDRLGAPLRRPAWGEADIRARVRAALAGGEGVWTVGLPGAALDLAARDPDAAIDGETVTARGPGWALRLRIGRSARGLEAFDAEGGVRATILAVHRSRLPDVAPAGVAEIGVDRDAIDPADRGAALFDLGLGAVAGRLMLRAADHGLAARLRGLRGASFAEALDALGPDPRAAGATLVAETPLARAEAGPDAAAALPRLAPAALDPGRDGPAGLPMPESFAVMAVLHRSAEDARRADDPRAAAPARPATAPTLI